MSRAAGVLFCALAWIAFVPSLAAQDGPDPHPDVSAFDAPVAEQIRAARRAVDELRAGDATAGELAEAHGRLGRIYHAYDLPQAARAAYERAASLAPSSGPWSYLLGVLLHEEGELDAAAEALARALDTAEVEAELVRAHLAGVEFDRGRHEEAAALARRVVDASAGRDAATVGGVLGPAHWVLGRVAVERGDLAAAAEHFERVLELQPGAGRVHYALAQVLRRTGETEAARRHLEKRNGVGVSYDDPWLAAVRAEVEGPSALRQQAAMELAAGREELGLELYRRALELAPESAAAHRDLASVLAARGEDGAAADLYRRATELEPERPINHAALGILLSRRGQHRESVASLRRAHELAPGDRTVRRMLAAELSAVGRQAAERGDAPRAIEALSEAVELDGELTPAHFALANLYGATRRFAAAADHYRRVTEQAPDQLAGWLGLATALHLAGRSDEAVQALRRAREVHGAHPALEEALSMLEGGG